MPLPVSDDPVTPEGRLYVSPSLLVGDGGLPIQQPIAPEVPTTDYTDANGNGVAARVINRLLGTGGEQRYQTWPEKLLRDALSAPHDVLNSKEPSTSADLIKPALDMSALAGTGGLAGVGEGGAATLGSSPFLRPALKYEGKIYKAPMGGQHMDAIPQDLQPEFTRQAMSGEDISNFNFGFMNHKGQFLDREKALKYAIDEGLMSPHDAKYGALTSTLMADNQPAFATKLLEEAGHLSSPEKAKFRLGQLLRDKADTKKAGGDVENDYSHYNNQIQVLRNYLKNPTLMADSSKEAAAVNIIRDTNADIGHESLANLNKPNHFYRGMSEAEYNNTIGSGKNIKSNESASIPGEGTNFSNDIRDAESYANFGRTDPRKTGKPNYLIEIKGSEGLKQAKDGYFKASGEIEPSRVTSVIKMHPEDNAILGVKIK